MAYEQQEPDGFDGKFKIIFAIDNKYVNDYIFHIT